MMDISCVPNVKGQSHLPIIVDPSHATGPARPDPGDGPGRRRGRVRRGACRGPLLPAQALSDGPQALLPAQYAQLMDEMRLLADALGRSIDACEGVTA
jgi:3-deoxy-7-phosphoheptulonate synthase